MRKVPQWSDLISAAPMWAGVYVIRNAERVIYVGQSKFIRKRLREQPKRMFFMSLGASSIDCIAEPNIWERLCLEGELQALYQPCLCDDLHHRKITREWIERSKSW